MTSGSNAALKRRDFLKLAGAASVHGLSRSAEGASLRRIAIVFDPQDAIASSSPVRRAADQLRKDSLARGLTCELVQSADQVAGLNLCIVVAPRNSSLANGFPPPSAVQHKADSTFLAAGHLGHTSALLVSGIGQRGFIYGLLELAERVRFASDPEAGLHLSEPVAEEPANEVRAVGRYFCSELEDKVWYFDKNFWREYLDVIIASRFNRFTLAYGLEYDFPRGVTDDYLHFPYPYLVEVPGYSQVHVLQLASPEGKRLASPVLLPTSEREKNMEMLRFIAAETGARGLHFQLGIWTHAYEWTASPNAYHHIEGLTPATHAAYCRDALAILLRECPEIQGLTMRVHGESGIPEGSYSFWKTLFEAISRCGRTIEIDMHAKGVNQTMIDIASATGMPVKLGAKYSAEHQSLGYNQADIRALEIPNPNHVENGPFSLSGGARLFTRYGYADFLRQGSNTQLLFRLWPGSQRHLLSGDPELCAAYARTSHFCGAAGIDLMEPLTFKGREGSGHPDGRCAYSDHSLNPKADWEKFEYYYRLWGRHLYDPDVNPEVWRRYLRREFGRGAGALETALANSSRLLPLVTSAHLPSASNHAFWPEIYDNMPIVLGSEPSPYDDTPSPKCFGTVSPLDPQLFSGITEHTQDLLDGNLNPKYSPIEVAQWLEAFAAASAEALAKARIQAKSPASPAFRRIEEDISIQNGLGLFFAAKFRSGVSFEIFKQSGSREAGRLALTQYQLARQAWATSADRARTVYMSDVSYGDAPMRRGHWTDRLADIDTDIATMQRAISSAPNSGAPEAGARALKIACSVQNRPSLKCSHVAPASFLPGHELSLWLVTSISAEHDQPTTVRLNYRHVNQGERWRSGEMRLADGKFRAAIPAEYTDSPFPLQYYFELRREGEAAWLHPGFNETLSNQPYYAVWAGIRGKS
jgi:hypothetical protein